jgi:hypothetical protein
MNYILKYLFVFIALVIILLSLNSCRKCEFFEIERKQKEGNLIQVGILPNTTPEMKDLMKGLNEVGGQMIADSEFDTVPIEYLDKDKIKNK